MERVGALWVRSGGRSWCQREQVGSLDPSATAVDREGHLFGHDSHFIRTMSIPLLSEVII